MQKKPHIDRLKKIRKRLEAQITNYNKIMVDTKDTSQSKKRYNFVDLFSGAGGNSVGLSMAGLAPIMSVEIDHDASETIRINFPEVFHHEGDIRELEENAIKRAVGKEQVHVLAAGFPCQGFSIAGKQDIKDERNSLYKEVIRFARILKPWYIVMENVPGIVNIGQGKFIDAIISDFDKCGYPGMSVSILESAAFGVPQIRPRTIFVANRFELPNPFPKPLLSVEKYVTIEEAIDDLKHKLRNPETNHEWTMHKPEMEKRIAMVAPGHSLYSSYTDANKRQYKGLPAMTIKENHGTTHIHHELNRTISAREMARLQSFPDSFKFYGRMKRVMWQVGNAAPPLLFKHMGLSLIPYLQKIEKSLG